MVAAPLIRSETPWGCTAVRNRSFHVAGLLSALTVLALVAATPASAAIGPSRNAAAVTGNLADPLTPGALTNSSFPVIAPNGNPAAGSDIPLTGFPTSGGTYSILSSGNTIFADDPNNATNTGAGNGGGDGGHGAQVLDLVTLRLDLNVPATANCFSVDFRFLSEEFPEFVGGTVNDAFVAELDNTDFTIGPSSEVVAPRNFAFDEGGNVISINTAGFAAANSGGTTYDGATSLLRASTPVTPGPHSIFLSIFDQGDSSYDSAVFLDRAALTNTPPTSCKAGASSDLTPPDTVITDGPAEGATVPPGVASFSFDSSEPGSGFLCSLDGAAFEACTSPRSYADLATGVHTFSVQAFDGAGNGDPTPATRSFTVAGDPVAGKSVNLEPVSGTVETKCKGDRGFSPLETPEQVAEGCIIDTTKGKVQLTSEGRKGRSQTAEFYDGVFRVKQKKGSPEVTLILVGELDCGNGNRGKRGRRRGGRGLWGDGDGRFTTRGNRGAGSVRGTKWFVGDTCQDTTYVKVKRGVVSFEDFVADRTVKVTAGEQYSTKPPKRR